MGRKLDPEPFGPTEIDVKSIKAHYKNVVGCQRHHRDIMISFNSNDEKKDGKDIIDLFLTQSDAEYLLETLQKSLELNKTEETE